MEFQTFKAKTVADAVMEASISLGASSDMIEYEVIEEGSAGLLRLFSKEAVIKARIKEEPKKEELKIEVPKKEEPKKEPVKKETIKKEEPKKETKKIKAEKDYDNGKVKEFLTQVLAKMDIDADIEIEKDDAEKVVNINIDGDDTGDLIGKRGQTLDALQYLASIIVNKEQDDYYRVKVDTKDYRDRRQKTLENLAKNIASKVKKTKKKITLEPMNPYERRIIHSYLQSDKFVTTKSEGEEPNRRVVVYYKKQ